MSGLLQMGGAVEEVVEASAILMAPLPRSGRRRRPTEDGAAARASHLAGDVAEHTVAPPGVSTLI